MSSPFMTALKSSENKSPLVTDPLKKSPINAPVVAEKPPTPSTDVDIQQVLDIGKGTGAQLVSFNKKVLEQQRFSSSGEMGEKLNALLKEAKGLDVKGGKGLKGLFGRILGWKEDLFAQFDTVEGRVNALKSELERDLRKNADSIFTLKSLREQIGTWVLSLERDITLLGNSYATLEEQYQALNQDSEAAIELRNTLDLIETKIGDIKANRLTGYGMGKRILGMEATANKLMSSGERVIESLIPIYMANFSLYIQSIQQKESALLQSNTIDAYNEALLAGSELASKNQVEASRLATRQLTSIETLQKDQELLLTAIEETSKINAQAREERITYINEVGKLEGNLLSKLRG